MGNEGTDIAAFLSTAALLEAIIERNGAPDRAPGGRGEVSAIARSLGIAVSTAHRQVATLVAAGFLQQVGRGRHVAGPRLRRLAASLDVRQTVANAAVGPLNALAARTRSIAQLGSLDDGMVTYRVKTGHGAKRLFTRVGMQLEAYCSGIGKALLAYLPAADRVAYLADGPFPKLTENTITDPAALTEELERIRACGYAIDNEEIAVGLRCFAVPIHDGGGDVIAAISLSTARARHRSAHLPDQDYVLLLREAAGAIERQAFPQS